MLTFACFKKVSMVYCRVGAGAGAASNFFLPKPEPHQNQLYNPTKR
jgi:hypothetical protein